MIIKANVDVTFYVHHSSEWNLQFVEFFAEVQNRVAFKEFIVLSLFQFSFQFLLILLKFSIFSLQCFMPLLGTYKTHK